MWELFLHHPKEYFITKVLTGRRMTRLENKISHIFDSSPLTKCDSLKKIKYSWAWFSLYYRRDLLTCKVFLFVYFIWQKHLVTSKVLLRQWCVMLSTLHAIVTTFLTYVSENYDWQDLVRRKQNVVIAVKLLFTSLKFAHPKTFWS